MLVLTWSALLFGCGTAAPPSEGAPPAAARALDGAVRWVAVGGGSRPDNNQASIEVELGRLPEVLGARGRLLYAAGPDTRAVQVVGRRTAPDPVDAALGDILHPLRSRENSYRATTLAADGPASSTAVRDTVSLAVARADDDVLLYLAGHGSQGTEPAGNALRLWGDEELTVEGLAGMLDAWGLRRTQVRVVATTCFSGGFADLAFFGADPTLGAAQQDRCGVFSTTWDGLSAGCDADPERAARVSFGHRLAEALTDPAGADLDGDGAVSLAEAHARARIARGAFDIPTTTSERWLRQVAPPDGPADPHPMPLEDAVIEALATRLGGAASMRARDRLQVHMAALAEAEAEAEAADDLEKAARRRVRGELTGRWPTLDDPWHPTFATDLALNRAAIGAYLARAPAVADLHEAQARAQAHRDRVARRLVRLVPWARLVRALDNRDLAARLRAQGGRDWERWLQFVACEQGPVR